MAGRRGTLTRLYTSVGVFALQVQSRQPCSARLPQHALTLLLERFASAMHPYRGVVGCSPVRLREFCQRRRFDLERREGRGVLRLERSGSGELADALTDRVAGGRRRLVFIAEILRQPVESRGRSAEAPLRRARSIRALRST